MVEKAPDYFNPFLEILEANMMTALLVVAVVLLGASDALARTKLEGLSVFKAPGGVASRTPPTTD